MAYQRPVVTEDNRGALIEFSAYLLITSSALTTLIKVFTKLTVTRLLKSDDWLSLASLVFAAGQCVALVQQVHGGLGQRISALTTAQLEQFQKAEYSVEILYVASIASARMVTLHFLATLALDRNSRFWLKIPVIANGVWLAIALLGVAFQCGGKLAWEVSLGTCFNRPAFWTVISTFDILVDLAVSLLPIYILRDLQTSRGRKMNAIIAFGGRILVIPATALRLSYIYSSMNSADPTFDDFNTILATAIVTNLSIIVACISFIKPFLDNIETGHLASKIRQQGEATSMNEYKTIRHAKTLFQAFRANERKYPLISDPIHAPENADNFEMYSLPTDPRDSSRLESRGP